jgi:hypothetical protein
MKKIEAKQLSEIFSNKQFSFSKLENATAIIVIKLQISVDPIAKELEEARKTALESLKTDEFEKLTEKATSGELKMYTPEAARYNKLSSEIAEKLEEILKDKADEEVEINTKITEKQFFEILESNKTSLTGDSLKILYTLIVDATKKDEDPKK